MSTVSMKDLLVSGVHFGHQTRRWNPKMKPYIFAERGGIYIIDLQQTTVLIDEAYAFLRNIAERNGTVLFVGTKKQAQEPIKEQAERVGMPFVNNRWLGGLLTNFVTLSKRIKRLHELRDLIADGSLELLPSREQIKMRGELEKLEKNLGGVAGMDRVPDAVFVVDPRKEAIGIKEANKLKIPVIALVDTNCDPDEIDFLIPGNDDAIRSCQLIVRTIADAVAEGRDKYAAEELVRIQKAAVERAAAEKVAAEKAAVEKAAADKIAAEQAALDTVSDGEKAATEAVAAAQRAVARAKTAAEERDALAAMKVAQEPVAAEAAKKAGKKVAAEAPAKPKPVEAKAAAPKADKPPVEVPKAAEPAPAAPKAEKPAKATPKAEKVDKAEKADKVVAEPAKKPAAKKAAKPAAEAPKADEAKAAKKPAAKKVAKPADEAKPAAAKPAKKPAAKKATKPADDKKAD